MASGVDTHTHTHLHESNFKKTRHTLFTGWHAPGLKITKVGDFFVVDRFNCLHSENSLIMHTAFNLF